VNGHFGLREKRVIGPPGVVAFKLGAPGAENFERARHPPMKVGPERFGELVRTTRTS
jgi:hypothetical protein